MKSAMRKSAWMMPCLLMVAVCSKAAVAADSPILDSYEGNEFKDSCSVNASGNDAILAKLALGKKKVTVTGEEASELIASMLTKHMEMVPALVDGIETYSFGAGGKCMAYGSGELAGSALCTLSTSTTGVGPATPSPDVKPLFSALLKLAGKDYCTLDATEPVAHLDIYGGTCTRSVNLEDVSQSKCDITFYPIVFW